MGTPARNYPKCYICDRIIFSCGKNILSVRTDHTSTIIGEILEQFVGRELQRTSQKKICLECFSRLNDYDLACLTAQQVQRELTKLLNSTEEKYGINIVAEFEQVRSTKNKALATALRSISDDDGPVKSGYHEVEIANESTIDFMKIETLDRETDEYELHLYTNKEKQAIDDIQGAEYIYEVTEHDEGADVNVDENAGCPENVENTTEESSTAKTQCKICHSHFETRKELILHRNQAHYNYRKEQPIYTCDICGQTYKSRLSFESHLARHNNGESPFKCDICNKHFTQKGALKHHKRIHTGERRFQCERCGKQFHHYSSFHVHNLTHDDIRESKCEVCGLLLRSNSHLSRHMLVHTGAKPHVCPKCGKDFAQRYNMMSHFRSHQGLPRKKKFPCPVCDQSFNRHILLEDHLESGKCSGAMESIDS